MLIASVKMKALKLPLMTEMPLKVPTARPTRSTTSRPMTGLHSVPNPSLAFGAINHAPKSGARPKVPCSEMSNLPVSRMSDSATTTIPSAAPPWATLIRLDEVGKTGLTIAPTIIKRMITGTSVSSRNQLSTISRGSRRATVRRFGVTARSAAVSAIESLDGRDQGRTIPRWLVELPCDLAPDHDEQAGADAEVLEIVGDEQHRHPLVARSADGIEQGF